MCFKKLIVASFLILVGCSKGSVPANELNLTFGSTDCVKGMSQRFGDFFAGKPNAADIHSNWMCVSQVVSDFVRLNKSDVFQKDDLKIFLADHFFKSGLSDQAVLSTMKVKQLLVGGAGESISKDEISILLNKVSELDSITATLAPHMRVLFGDGDVAVSDAQWDQSFAVFSEQLPRLSALLSAANKNFFFSDAQTFIQAWADQLKLASDSPFRKIADAMPLLAKAKTLLVAGADDRVRPPEWNSLFQQIDLGFSTYRTAKRLIDLHPDDVSLALREPRLQGVVQNLITILKVSTLAQKNKQLKLNDINDFLTQLESKGYLPASITAAKAEIALQFLIDKIFAAPGATADALDVARLAEMQKFVDRWNTIKTAYESGQVASVPEFAQVIQVANWPLGLDSSGRIQIPPSVASLQPEYVPLFTVLEWLGSKWGTWPLSRDTFHAIVADALNVLHAFNWLSSTDDTISVRLLREANLFMPSANGNMQLERAEAFQYALFALSSYRSSHQLSKLAKDKCQDTDFACYQSILLANRQTVLSNIPALNAWLGNDPRRFQDFTASLNVISGTTYLMEFMVINYIETFMQRFDQNGDGLINLNEAMAAYPIYGPVLTEMLAKYNIDASEIQALYTFMFNYGATPFSMFGGSVRYLYWKWNLSSWSFSADRKTLASILAELAKL